MVDPRFIIKYKMDEYVNNDKTLRFYATDQNLDSSVALKLYFNTNVKQCEFQNMEANPDFKESLDDCNSYKILNNRLYNQPSQNNDPIDTTANTPIYNDILIPQCISPKMDNKGKTHYINIFTLPDGENLKEKCIHGLNVTKNNSCISHVKSITTGLLHAMALFNSQNRFFKHSNLFPQNVYLYMKNEDKKVFLDNIFYDSMKYDDIEAKSFKSDFNMLGDLLIMILTGNEDVKLREPFLNTFDLFLQIREFIEDRNLEINLKTNNLGVPEGFMKDNLKCQTITELDHKLLNSIFNFIYRLKCSGTKSEDQFMEISQALDHQFINGGSNDDNSGNDNNGDNDANNKGNDENEATNKGNHSSKLEGWDAVPADY